MGEEGIADPKIQETQRKGEDKAHHRQCRRGDGRATAFCLLRFALVLHQEFKIYARRCNKKGGL